MKNLFKNYSYVILLFVICIIGTLLLSACSSNTIENKKVHAAEKPVYTDEYVFENFIITEIKKGGTEIYGELEHGSGEGIYIDKSYYDKFNKLKGLKIGDKIKVTYDKEDYDNEIWDNILDIEITDK